MPEKMTFKELYKWLVEYFPNNRGPDLPDFKTLKDNLEVNDEKNKKN